MEFLVWTVLSGGDEAALARQGAGGKTPHTIWMMVVIEGATHHAGRLWLAFVVVNRWCQAFSGPLRIANARVAHPGHRQLASCCGW